MGIVEYLTDDDHFVVDEGGVVTTNKALDYEGSGGKYDFHVYAKNPGESSFKGSGRFDSKVSELI